MRVFVIAGEASGDRLGAALMDGLKTLEPGVTFDGVGGAEMTARGLQSRFLMEELSVMGIAEVLPKYRALKRRIRECAAAVLADPPDVLIGIDSPDFCLRVARIVRQTDPSIRIVHYVAPSVWAWRPKRAAKMARWVDQVLCLLPFEPPYMEAEGMRADFVGHPVTTETQAGPDETASIRTALGIGDAPLILALPGSRKGEVTRLAPHFGAALQLVLADHPDARVVVPTTRGVGALVCDLIANWPGDPVILAPDQSDPFEFAETKRAAFAAANVALAASGTVSLELAAAGTPMVIAYDMNPISRFLIGRLLKIDTVTLVNLVSDTRAVPEFLGPDCRAEQIAPALKTLLADPSVQDSALEMTMERLGRGGQAPGLRAAHAVIDGLAARGAG